MSHQYQQPGKATQPQQQAPVQTPTPGKTTLADTDQAIRTGGAGTGCSSSGLECFLTQPQRTVLIAELMGRVNAAHGAYLSALGDLHVEKFVDKETEMPWWASIMLGAAGTLIEHGVMGAVRALKVVGAATHAVTEATGTIASHEAATVIGGVTEKEVEWIVKTAVDQGKDALKKPVTAAANAGGGTERTAAMGFIDYLRDASMGMFQHLREDPPGYATDAQLLALWKTFDGSRHTPTMYRETLDQQIKRYLASHASKIGRRSDIDGRTVGGIHAEVRVGWLKVGGGKRLIYLERTFPAMGMQPGGAYVGEHALSMEEGPTPVAPLHGEEMLGYVEDEFVDVALAQHESTWLQAPETFEQNFSTLPPSLRKV